MYSVITYCTSNTRLFRDSRWQCILCRFWRSTQQQQEQGAFPTNLPTWQSLQTGTVCKMATRNSSTHNRLASMSWILFRRILFPVVISRDIRPCWKVQILSWPRHFAPQFLMRTVTLHHNVPILLCCRNLSPNCLNRYIRLSCKPSHLMWRAIFVHWCLYGDTGQSHIVQSWFWHRAMLTHWNLTRSITTHHIVSILYWQRRLVR